MATTIAPVPAVIFANRYQGSRNVVMHDHAGIELVLVLRGHCRIHVGGQVLSAGAGELFVLPARVPHDQQNHGEVETLYVEFTAPPRHFSEHPRVLPVPLGSWAATWIKQLVALDREPVPPPVRSGLALALIAHLNHLEERNEIHRALPQGVAAAVRLMEEDLRAGLIVDDLTRASGLSASHLAALFRRHLGCAPMAWLQQQRLELACRLLRNGSLSVAEVAAACGYPDANYFARLFRQRHGSAPGAWRRRKA
ncbi:MAG: helix-turn-helix transcriptional regulator [Planctomycetes bacterium]|nr:helix-turn-helix transcriptional regulator [Planctomycetota bacterium]